MTSVKTLLEHRFDQALVRAFGDALSGTDPMLAPTNNPKFGDYQANVAMSLAKPLKQAPRAIAEQIVQHLDSADLCEPPEIAGPGFINLRLKTSFLENELKAIQHDQRLGVTAAAPVKRIIVDYPSPNIAKEMHVGHLRPSVIGDCLARILEFLGHNVLRLSHIGDWGTPFGMLIAYLREAYPEALATTNSLDLGDLASFYRAAKKRFDEDEAFQAAARQSVVQLQAGDEDTIHAWKIVCDLSNRTNRKIFDLMGLSPKIQERGESFYNPLLPSVLEELNRLGLLVEDNGAQCVFLDGFTNKDGNPLPLIVQKSDGGYNYATTDLAAIRYRVQEDQIDRVVYPVGMEQTNHFAQIFQVGKRAGWITDEVSFDYAPLGSILGEDGKKLKSRSGEAVRLVDLLDEAIARARADLESRLTDEGRTETEEFIHQVAQVVGIGSVKYADLSQNRTSNYIFNYDKMLALQGNTAPYMLYAYVRVQGISRKGGIDFEALGLGEVSQSPVRRAFRAWSRNWIASAKLIASTLPPDNLAASANNFVLSCAEWVGRKLDPAVSVHLAEETELVLARHLLQFEDVLHAVEQDLLPNRLCEYLFELSKKFNQFYDRCPVLQAEEPTRTSRLILADLTARTIKLGLSLLGISVLERM